MSAANAASGVRVTLGEALGEFLSHLDNWLFIVPPLLMGGALLVLDPQPVYLLWFVAGWLIFLPQEYLTHVLILHHRPLQNRFAYRQQYRLHLGHHDFPRRLDLMYMPRWLTLPMTAINAVLLYLVTDSTGQWLAALSGTFVGYVVFEWSHMLCHVPYVPSSQWLRRMRRRHLWHHYRDETRWFAVSLPCAPLDELLRSGGQPDGGANERSRYLGVAPDDPRLLAAREHFAGCSSGSPDCSRIWLGNRETAGSEASS